MSDMPTNVREIVFDNLDAAVENEAFGPGGYLDDMSAEEIADDMVCLAEDCEDMLQEDLLPFIREWLVEFNKRRT